MLLSWPSSGGSVPCSPELYSPMKSRLDRLPNDGGMVPSSRLSAITKYCINVSAPSSGGSVPVKWFFCR